MRSLAAVLQTLAAAGAGETPGQTWMAPRQARRAAAAVFVAERRD